MNESIETQKLHSDSNQTASLAKLREEYERLQSMFSASPNTILLFNDSYELIDCNPAALKFLRFETKEEIIAGFAERMVASIPAFQPDGRASIPITERFMTAMKEGFVEFETELLLDGEKLDLRVEFRRITYKDNYAIVVYAVDITERKLHDRARELRHNLRHAVNNAAGILLALDDNEASDSRQILESMEIIGRSVDADHVEIWQNEMRDGELHAVLKHYWQSEIAREIGPDYPVLSFPYSAAPEWESRLSRGENIQGPVSGLSREDQEFLSPFKLKSILVVPIKMQHQFWGICCIDDSLYSRNFTEDEVGILRSASYMLAYAINRISLSATIREANKRAQVLLDKTPLACQAWDSNFNKIGCNEEAVRLFGFNDKNEYLARYFELYPEYQPDGQSSEEKAAIYLKRALDEGRSCFNWTYKLLDGSLMPAEVVLIRSENMEDYAILGYARDLREHYSLMDKINKQTSELEVQRSTLQGIINSIPDLVFCKDSNFHYTLFNTACADFLNADMSLIVGKNDVELGFPDEVIKTMRSSDERIYAGENKVVYDSWIPSPDGLLRYYETSKAPIMQDGAIVGLVGISRDITEKYRMEQELEAALEQSRSREQELITAKEQSDLQLTKLNMVIKAAKIGLWEKVIMSDDLTNPTNAFNWSNEFRHMLGFSDESDFPNVLGSWSDRLHPDDKDQTLDYAVKHLLDKTGKIPYDAQYRLMKKDGEYGHFSSYGETLRDEHGNPILISGAMMDITEAKNAAIDNELQLTKLNLVIKATKIGLWEMKIVHDDPANPANAFNWSNEFRHMLGFSDESDFPNVLGSWMDRLHPEDKAYALAYVENHLLDKTGKTPYDAQYRLMKKDGEYGHFHAYGETLRDEHGNAVLFSGAFMDITEAKNASLNNELQLAKLKLVVQATKIGLWEMKMVHDDPANPANAFVWSNEFRHMLGFSDESDFPNVFGSWMDRLHPEDKAHALAYVENHLLDKTSKTPYDAEYRLLKKDGEYGHFHAYGKTLRDENGNAILFSGALMDITEAKNALLNNELQLAKLTLAIKGGKMGLWDMRVVKDDPINPANIFNWSNELRHILGFSNEDDFPNMLSSWSDQLHPEDKGRTLDAFKQHLLDASGKTPYDIEYRLMKKDGEYGHYHAAGATIRDGDGNAVQTAGVLKDISEWKQMTEALNDAFQESLKNENIMSSMLNSSDMMIHVTDKDTNEILFINDYTRRHFRVAGDAIGQRCYDIFNPGVNRRCDWCPCNQLDKEPDKAVVWEQYNDVTKCHYRMTDRYIDWPNGKKVHIQYRIDLTDIKQMQETLENNQKMLYAVNRSAYILLNSNVETFADALSKSMKILTEAVAIHRMTIWKNSRVEGRLYCSMTFIWPESLTTLYDKKLITDVSYSEQLPGWEEILSSGKHINDLTRNMAPEAQAQLSAHGVLSFLSVPVFVEDQFWGQIGFDNCCHERVFTDAEESILQSISSLFIGAWLRNKMLTDLRDTSIELEFALEHAEAANRAKSDFLSAMSHEIRTPMNVILGVTEMQLQNEKLDHNMREIFNKIYVAGDLLLGIINDILDLSKIDAGKMELAIKDYEIASLISDTIQLNIMRVGSKPIEFELHVDENMPALLAGDELRIKQILNNLLSNAFKYTIVGKVRLSVFVENDNDDNLMLVFRVSDTGPGMTQGQLEIMFDKFTRFTQDANRAVEGTGLGMSITKSLTQLMNGDISVQSLLGKGTTFTVRLPQGKVDSAGILGRESADNLCQLRTNNRAQMKRARITRDPMPYGKVLIVDDVESNIYVAIGLLAPYGLKIEAADSGFAAVEKIENGNVYDIIFMDHMMPKMDGMEATKIIRGMGYEGSIVALTANAVVGQASMFLNNGFDDFIPKPIDIRLLNTVLNKLIRDKHSPAEIAAASAAGNAEQDVSVNARIAESFVRDANKAIAMLEAIINKYEPHDDEDRHTYEIYVHGMKSALANVGKMELSAAAHELELSVQAEGAEIITSETSTFIDALREAVADFTPKATNDEPTNEDRSYLREKLLAVQAACKEYDEKTANEAMAQLREKPWLPSAQELLLKISGHLLHSDFDLIVGAVDKFMESEQNK
ncbi:MAG: PAS domain-containing protein [Betaproteobacteria bacterium]|nr:PAS domain-containing protein [Betaproteobacteria bacterium]